MKQSQKKLSLISKGVIEVKLAVIGATGKAGSRIVTAALKRGIDVTAIVRNQSKLTVAVPVIETEVQHLTKSDVAPFDVVVNAFAAPLVHPEFHREYGQHLIDIFTGISTRLIVVGGAGSLYTDDTRSDLMINHFDVPDALKAVMNNQLLNEQDLEHSDILWTFVSPASFFDANGKQTNQYQILGDVMGKNQDGDSYVSYTDFASAIVDEVQNARHVQQHISVVSEKG